MMTNQPSRTMEVLLVEDNLGDAFLTRECFSDIPFPINLHHVEDGEQCLDFLRKAGPFGDAPTPDLILLDLNMPRMDGRQVMAEIAADERLRHLPVVILTTSAAREDVDHMYGLRCSSYIVKPLDLEHFRAVVKTLADYWFTIVALPGEPG